MKGTEDTVSIPWQQCFAMDSSQQLSPLNDGIRKYLCIRKFLHVNHYMYLFFSFIKSKQKNYSFNVFSISVNYSNDRNLY